MPLSAAIASDLGSIRAENQDRAVIVRGQDRQGRDYALVAVADGIGGMEDGDTCAAMAIAVFIAAIDQCAQSVDVSSDNWLRQGAYAANQAVFSKFRASGGSTLVALLIRPGCPPYWLSIGDSRVYSMDEKTLTQCSIDDTIAGQLGKAPEDASEQSRLLQFVGMGADLEPHIASLDPDSVDAIILTTDGVHYLAQTPGWLGQIVRHSPDPGVCVKRLIDLAKWCGGPDNATVAIITLPVDIQPETRLPFPCLDVWDAYGELRIANTTFEKAHSYPVASSAEFDQTARATSASSVGRLDPVVEHPSSSQPKQSKTRRAKTPRKPKKSAGKQSKDPDKLTEQELPQLDMEFPTKSKKQEPSES